MSRALLADLARRAPLPGKDTVAFVDIDSTQKRVYRCQKQGAAFGHAKIQGKACGRSARKTGPDAIRPRSAQRRRIAVEYLVTMTTHVPDGTPEQAVDDVRAREAAHSRDLAAEGRLLRLWRPPLQPGEWRSLGLFAAGDAGQLQQTLASMPLQIWRTDQVTPLAPNPNDPGPGTRPGQSGAEFLAAFVVTIPAGTPRQAVEDAEAGEAARARELADQGHLERLWALPGQGRALGLYRARDSAEMEAIVKALPLGPWMMTELTPLTPHPSDPAAMSTWERRKP